MKKKLNSLQLDWELAKLLQGIPVDIYERLLDSLHYEGDVSPEDIIVDFKKKLRSYRRKHGIK